MYKSKIKTVADAFTYTGRDIAVLEAFNALPEQDRAYAADGYKRTVVIEALNKEANKGKPWSPDWSNSNEWKYYSWVWIKKNDEGTGFVFNDTHYNYARAYTLVGSHLCFKKSECVEYFNKQFADLLQTAMLG